MSTKVYEEIKYLALKFPQLIPKEDFIQIIGHISSDVILTHQLNNALVVFDTDEDKCDYLKNYSKPLKKTAHDLANFEVIKESLTRDIQNRCEKIAELELSLNEIRETYNNVLRNSNNKAEQKHLELLERNLEQLTNDMKSFVERNSSLKKEVAINQRKLLARNERIQALEALLQDAQEKLTTQSSKFEAQLQAVRERLEQARSEKSSFGRISKPLRGGIPVSDRGNVTVNPEDTSN